MQAVYTILTQPRKLKMAADNAPPARSFVAALMVCILLQYHIDVAGYASLTI